MKRYILSIFMLCFLLTPTHAQRKFNVHITTPLEVNGTKIFINIMDNDKRKVLVRDSAIVNNHSISFSGTLSQPSSFASFYTRFNKGYSLQTMIVDTGRNEFVLSELPNKSKPNSSIIISAFASKSNQIKFGLDSIEAMYFNKKGKRESSGLITLNKEDILAMNLNRINYLKRYPRNYASLITLYEISLYHRGSIYVNTILETLKSFDPAIQNSSFGSKFYREKMDYLNSINIAKIGSPVPEFSVKDLAGKMFNNGSLLGQNYVIVFSATWCVPCQKSLPEIKALYEKYKARGLKLVYFNDSDDAIRWREHVQKNKLTWINVSERVKADHSKITKLFNVYTIPSYFVIGEKGTIIHNSVESNSSVAALRKSLEQIYGEAK